MILSIVLQEIKTWPDVNFFIIVFFLDGWFVWLASEEMWVGSGEWEESGGRGDVVSG